MSPPTCGPPSRRRERGSIFSAREADLSGLSAEPGLCVDVFRHRVRFVFDETGARGAAATAAAVSARGWSETPEPWTFDRPFLFVLQEESTGAVTFLGRYVGGT